MGRGNFENRLSLVLADAEDIHLWPDIKEAAKDDLLTAHQATVRDFAEAVRARAMARMGENAWEVSQVIDEVLFDQFGVD